MPIEIIAALGLVGHGISWAGKKAWQAYKIYNDAKEKFEETAKEYWNKVKAAAAKATTAISGLLTPVFGVLAYALSIPLSLAASVFAFVVAMVAIGFGVGVMSGLKPSQHNWDEESAWNYVKHPRLLVRRGYHLFYSKLQYYWQRFGIYIVRVGVPVLFSMLVTLGAATPVGWSVIGAVAVMMVVGFGIGWAVGKYVGKTYRAKVEEDIKEHIVGKKLEEDEQVQLTKLMDIALGENLRFAPMGAYGLPEFSQEEIVTLVLLENNGSLPQEHKVVGEDSDQADLKLSDNFGYIGSYYNPAVKLLAFASAIHADRDLIKGQAFVEHFRSYLEQEQQVIKGMKACEVKIKG